MRCSRKYCATCHTLKASNAVGKVGPNLDVLHPPKGLILDAIANGRARGQGQMPAGLVDGQDAQDVAAYVAAVAGRGVAAPKRLGGPGPASRECPRCSRYVGENRPVAAGGSC